jgi:putative DNA primase/helicase
MHMMTAAEIAAALGGATRNGYGWLARCCCHEDRQPSLSLKDGDDGRLLVKCFADCDARDILAELRARGWLDAHGCDFRPARKAAPLPKRTELGKTGYSDRAAAIWRKAVNPRDTLGERYLNGRGLALDDALAMRVLRFHGRCPFKDENNKTIYVPALVAAFRPFRDDDEARPPLAIHRIGLNPDGSKRIKKMLGPVAGCAVKLDPDDMVEEGLGIVEGIETGIAARMTGWRPIWVLGSKEPIAKFKPVPGIACLTIFADNDESGAGLAAARQCAGTWRAAGREVFIRTRREVGADWADPT